MKKFHYIAVILLSIFSLPALAQTDKATTQRIVQDQDFVFQATSAMPMANADVNRVLSRLNNPGGAGNINLSGSQYDLTIKKDSIVAYLPYYGRAYTSTMNPDDSGIKFKSKNFSYSNTKRKKGGWIISILTKDVKDNQRMTLNVSENGYATLNVTSNNRQPISFYGYISEPKKEKK